VRAQAASGPDEDVAAELERSAGRAQVRGGFAAAAAFLERATVLTPDPARRGARTLAAAQAKYDAAAPDRANELLVTAETAPLDELQRAAAATLLEEADAIAAATGIAHFDYASLLLAALRGEETWALAVIEVGVRYATARARDGQSVTPNMRPRSCTTALAATGTPWLPPSGPASMRT
jgi:hypothetical protein